MHSSNKGQTMRNIFRPHYKRHANGVTRIVRDNYSRDWYTRVREVLERDGYQCRHVAEGSVCRGTENLEVHHIRPLSAGGTTVNSNLITLCEKHHLSRHPKMERK